ncbi:MAG TPA: hypothetical protein HA260_00905 [Thermoplasmata archaeon]|jgi:hypothetical protein|nr:hypothetical protein [Thermoplasmata archaeon]
MKNQQKFILTIVVISILGATAVLAAGTGLPIGTITVSPSAPAALSTITISVPISGEAPSEVRVKVEECNGNTGICYPDIQNVSMPLASSSIYRAEVTLKHSDATYITVTVIAKINGAWQESSQKKVNLSVTPDGNNGDDNGSPGFELVVMVMAIGVSLILISRKRMK